MARYSNIRYPRCSTLSVLIITAILVSFLVLSGCAKGSDASDGAPESAETLTIYAARSENLVAPLVQQFSDNTGIDVQVKYGSAAELTATLLEEGPRSPADVFYARDPGGIAALSGRLVSLSDEVLNSVPDWARAPDGSWVGTSARVRAVVYNTEKVSDENLPDTLENFTLPEWKGRIGWSPTSGPTQTMITAMRVLWGEDRTKDWLQGFMDNEPIYYPNHTATVAGVGAGEVDIGLVNHYYLLRFVEESGEDFPARNHHLSEAGPGNLVMVVGAGILLTSENKENAEKFLLYLLSQDAQTYLTQKALDYPLVDGIPLNPLLKPLAEIRVPDIDQTMLSDIKGTESLMREVGVIP